MSYYKNPDFRFASYYDFRTFTYFMTTLKHLFGNDYELLKGTDVRELLLSKKTIPKWLVSNSVSNVNL